MSIMWMRLGGCPKNEHSEWQDLGRLHHKCSNYPKALFFPQQLNDANGELIRWKTYEYVTENETKRIKLVCKETTPSTIIR